MASAREMEAKLADPNITEAAKEVIRHEPGAAKDIQTGSGVVRQLMSDVRTKEGATRQKMDHEAGPEHAPPPSGPTGATTEGLGAHAAPGSAASGMGRKDFDASIAQETKGAETPDGDLAKLHLHSAHGDEGVKSKAYEQVTHHAPPHPPEGCSVGEAPPLKLSNQDHHRKKTLEMRIG